MVKLRSPLMSLSASGKFAKLLTYSTRASGAQVRYQKNQKDVITSLRTIQRGNFLTARDSWTILDIGTAEYGFCLFGFRDYSAMSEPLGSRCTAYSSYIRDFLKTFF